MTRVAPFAASLAGLTLAAPAFAQGAVATPSGADALREVLTTVLALGVVCALAFVCLLVLKRLQAGPPPPPGAPADLRFVRALPVGARERLVVVRWRGRTLLLGVTAASIALLDADGAAEGAGDTPAAALAPAELTRTLLARVFARRPRDNPS